MTGNIFSSRVSVVDCSALNPGENLPDAAPKSCLDIKARDFEGQGTVVARCID
jgi:hypothetical protein